MPALLLLIFFLPLALRADPHTNPPPSPPNAAKAAAPPPVDCDHLHALLCGDPVEALARRRSFVQEVQAIGDGPFAEVLTRMTQDLETEKRNNPGDPRVLALQGFFDARAAAGRNEAPPRGTSPSLVLSTQANPAVFSSYFVQFYEQYGRAAEGRAALSWDSVKNGIFEEVRADVMASIEREEGLTTAQKADLTGKVRGAQLVRASEWLRTIDPFTPALGDRFRAFAESCIEGGEGAFADLASGKLVLCPDFLLGGGGNRAVLENSLRTALSHELGHFIAMPMDPAQYATSFWARGGRGMAYCLQEVLKNKLPATQDFDKRAESLNEVVADYWAWRHVVRRLQNEPNVDARVRFLRGVVYPLCHAEQDATHMSGEDRIDYGLGRNDDIRHLLSCTRRNPTTAPYCTPGRPFEPKET